MADFDTGTRSRINSVTDAAIVVQQIQTLYQQARSARTSLLLYQAGTNTVFNAAVNAIYTTTERQDLAAVLTQINALVTYLENSHADLLSV